MVTKVRGCRIEEDSTFRIIDANYNRTKEALRILEDICRFALLNKNLSGELRKFRHTLEQTMDKNTYLSMINARNSAEDPGKTFFGTGRNNISDIAIANLQRIQEALRSLEEIYKTVSLKYSNIYMKLRFQIYDFAKKIMPYITKENIPKILLYIIGDTRCWFTNNIYESILRKELFVVQFREQAETDRNIARLIRKFVDFAHNKGVKVIINNRADLCLAFNSDGVHLGKNDLPPARIRSIISLNKYIGLTTHTIHEFSEALKDNNIDYISFGTIFKSRTKSNRPYYGEKILNKLRQINADKQPVLIGGINLDNLDIILDYGFTRIAVSNAIFSSEKPQRIIDTFLNKMNKAL
jgi:thiamine-phosphate pyrophosphorylase